ncbi:MAG: IS1182 family transposase [Terriglobales bacterium]
MSLRPLPFCPVPEETARVAHAAFPKGHPYLRIRDTLGALFSDEQFVGLYATRGQPAEAPWRLALVSVIQFAEDLSDEQAADAVRDRVAWKYLLALPLEDAGFDASVLCEFRDRLAEGGEEELLFNTLLKHLREQQLLKARLPQRTDATHVLAAIRTLHRLELVGESVRGALNTLAVVAPEWVLAVSEPAWSERYDRPFESRRLPKSEKQRTALAQTIGRDGVRLLSALYAPEAPPWLRELPAVQTLRQIWVEQFYHEGDTLRLRRVEDLPPAGQRVNSPYDPEARYAQKRETQWIGYKVHFTETCDPDLPPLITDVQTTPASVHDGAVLPQIQAKLSQRELLPNRQFADGAYLEGSALVDSREQYGIELVGPVPEDVSWQAREGTGYGVEAFELDWEAQRARCPEGEASSGWRERKGKSGTFVVVSFPPGVCHACERRPDCTTAKTTGRQLKLQPQSVHEALTAGRQRARTPEYEREYAVRAGIEGTHTQAVRQCGLRQSRYVGEGKVRLQHLLIGTALNFLRVGAWYMGSPRARTRHGAFARLALAA